MSISLQTNVNALVAQQNLSVNQMFQSKTIQQLTSGYRINSSGDDAAGLAVANKFRNQIAELTQGVNNGNDGVAQLQIMDGGMANISQMLDRLQTLAMQSASASFTGNRVTLNNEFQADVAEIDRQAQSIGLNAGGVFAKSLGIYLGAGSGSQSVSNSVVTVDLTSATVDSSGLGLKGMQSGNQAYDLSTNHLLNIISGNAGSGIGTTFVLNGPNFNNLAINVATSGVNTASDLVSNINSAIALAAKSNAGLAAAGITASMTTSTAGNQVLTFTSAGTAFQVRAGDLMANALLGNTTSATSTTAASMTSTLTGQAYAGNFAAGDNIVITVQGGGLSAPVQLSPVTVTGGGGAVAADRALILAAINGNAALTATGITANFTAGSLNFVDANGQAVQASVAGDTNNYLAYGSFVGTANTVQTAGGAYAAGALDGHVYMDLQTDGGATARLDLNLVHNANGATEGQALSAINQLISADATWKAAGISAIDAGGKVSFVSNNGTNFTLSVTNDGVQHNNLGFYAAAARDGSVGGTANLATQFAGPATAAAATFKYQDSQGAYQLGSVIGGVGTAQPLTYSGIAVGTDSQALTLSAADATGANHSTVITLDATHGSDIDHAIAYINSQIQGLSDTTLKGVYAVKVNASGTEKIEFESAVQHFSLNIGSTGTGAGVGSQGTTVSSVQVGSGGSPDISTQTGAQAAVTAITAAVQSLGAAQAVVGKGENALNYAVSLATSQITNYSVAQSNIRDANVAQEAANLTKAQVLNQAAVAAMAQANSAPQVVLSLLRG